MRETIVSTSGAPNALLSSARVLQMLIASLFSLNLSLTTGIAHPYELVPLRMLMIHENIVEFLLSRDFWAHFTANPESVKPLYLEF